MSPLRLAGNMNWIEMAVHLILAGADVSEKDKVRPHLCNYALKIKFEGCFQQDIVCRHITEEHSFVWTERCDVQAFFEGTTHLVNGINNKAWKVSNSQCCAHLIEKTVSFSGNIFGSGLAGFLQQTKSILEILLNYSASWRSTWQNLMNNLCKFRIVI